MAHSQRQSLVQPEASRRGLRANTLGLFGASVIGLVLMGPAIGFYGNWGIVASISGGAPAFAFLIGGLVIAPTALSYAFLSRRLSSAGSAYTWAAHSISRHVGNWLGWMMLPFYILSVGTISILFALFFNSFLSEVGANVSVTNYGTFALGLVINLVLAGVIAYTGIEVSAKAAAFLVTLEMLVVVALGATIFVERIGSLNSNPFNPAAGTFTYNGFWLIMPIAVFSYLGFDVVSMTAEETKLAKRYVPLATVIGVVLLGLFAVCAAYAFMFAVPLGEIQKLIGSGITPVIPIGHKYWGTGGDLISVIGMTGSLGVTVAAMAGAGRIMYAMGRDRALPDSFGRVNSRYKVPWASMTVALTIALAFDLIMSWQIGLINSYAFLGEIVVFFALITYLFVNVGNLMLYLRDRSTSSWAWNGAIPVLGIIVTLALLYKSFFQALWNAGWVTIGRSIIVSCVAYMIIGILYAIIVRNRARIPRLAIESEPAGIGEPADTARWEVPMSERPPETPA